MTVSTTQPPPPLTTGGPSGGPGTDVATVTHRQGVGIRPVSTSSTRRFLDRWLWRLPVVLGLTVAASVGCTFLAQQSARSVADAAAPALIDLQDLLGNMAEANAAATSAHLSIRANGVEDRVGRGLYTAAVDRALAETVSTAATGVALDGVDDVAASVGDYRAGVEAARLANINGLADADELLLEALALVEADVEPAVGELTDQGQRRIDDQIAEASTFLVTALAAATAALLVMGWMQVNLAQRTRRVLNRYLLAASVAVISVIALLAWSLFTHTRLLDDAVSGGYNAVTAIGLLQRDAFALQSSLSIALLDTDQAEQRRSDIIELLERVDGAVAGVGAGADSPREGAAAETLNVRWRRYRDTVDEITVATASGDSEGAVTLQQGQALAGFNGLNTAIDSALFDNRFQFLDGAQGARRAVEFLPWIVLALGVLAALLSVAGVQQRRQDYQ